MNRVRNFLLQNRFLALLAVMAVRLLGVPLFYALMPQHEYRFIKGATDVLVVLILLSALFAVSRTRRALLVSALLFGGSAVADTLCHFGGNEIICITGAGFELLFLSWCTGLIIGRIFHAQTVSADTIAASLCAYLLMGLAWGALFELIELLHPGSFSLPAAGSSFDAVYLSFVTLSTLGLGDITSQSSSVRMLVSCEALTGQIYLAVLVARLVGLHIAVRR